MLIARGYRYEGEFKGDKSNGQGILMYPSTEQREIAKGHFVDNMLSGFGVVCFRDGRIYEGEWSSGAQQGYGVMTWPDGWVYEGNWRKNEPRGRGRLIPPHDSPIDQMWSGSFKPHHRL